jgi:subtilisin family serine protease
LTKVDNLNWKFNYLDSLGEIMRTFLLLSLVLGAFTAQAATIAVIDSGVDTEHTDFANKLWINPKEIADNNRDEDMNGYQDDVYGWNFAEGNNLVIDRSYLGTFSNDPYKFFEIQGKLFMGTATREEQKWVEAKLQDDNFRKEMGKFGNFVHGTHVAGITQVQNTDAKILSVKLIPTEVKLPGQNATSGEQPVDPRLINAPEDVRWKLLAGALKKLAEQQMLLLEEIAYYVGQHKAEIANGSFGTGFDQAKMITNTLYKVFFFKAPSEEDSNKAAKIFMDALLEQGKTMVKQAPNTLFVFAAGNSAMDNDKFPTSPTNIVADNVISVAATYEYKFLAPFSNYGEKMVDVAAPGMLIHSQIPGNEYLKVSGTSQAAPYVANIAAKIKDINTKLTPKEIKQIIMGTVDKKGFLQAKVSTAGIVNMDRAVYAANQTFNMSIADAINAARTSVADVATGNTKSMVFPHTITPIPMPSLFNIK